MFSKGKVLVAMSGGVDSSVAAYLLKRDGYEVAGATIKVWQSGECQAKHERSCCSIEAIEDARAVARKIGIPHYVFDLEADFKRDVVDYFTHEYSIGHTPNPCIVCNEKIKFGKFYDEAKKLGFDLIATGHYAKIMERNNRYLISEGRDKSKDQSYVLFSLPQSVLAHTLFPLGEKSKEEVRQIAKGLGLRVAEKPESMEICFVPDNDYAKFLLKESSLKSMKGEIRFKDGKKLGEHDGFFNYTIGQRRGLGVAFTEPLFVIGLRPEKNEIIVGVRGDVLASKFHVKNIHWMTDAKDITELDVLVKIRANFEKAPARIEIAKDKRSAEVTFKEPQEAITPGQAGVFYDGEVVLGGGWIQAVDSK